MSCCPVEPVAVSRRKRSPQTGRFRKIVLEYLRMHSSYSAVLLIPLWVRVFRSCPLPQATNSNTKILHVSWIIPGVDSDARMRAMQTWKSRRVYSHSLRWELQHCSSQVAGTAHSSGSGRSSAGSLLAVAIYYRGSGNALILQVSWIIPGVDADAKMRTIQTWKYRRVCSHSLHWGLQHCSSQVAGTAHSSGSGRSSAGNLLPAAIYYRGSGNAFDKFDPCTFVYYVDCSFRCAYAWLPLLALLQQCPLPI